MSLVGVLLAAGASRRMGRPKALVKRRHESFVAHGVRHLWSACGDVVVVLGSQAANIRPAIEAEFERLVVTGRMHDDLASAHRHGADGLALRFVVNPRWRQGMLSSSRAGLRQALRLRPDAVLLLPVDHPQVRPATVISLGEAMRGALSAYRGGRRRATPFAYALVPRYRRRRGHPVALSPALARAIVLDRGATDLSDAIRRNARLVGYLDGVDPGVLVNRNRP
ncbi:MAG TPA: NTP transferase domain-containing protein [Candidatus Limnocylindria bacterium]|nr:NTP transferase domain-containing protein [Candidatus Limnocylindria bacterium]